MIRHYSHAGPLQGADATAMVVTLALHHRA